jgi:hypothetical protein
MPSERDKTCATLELSLVYSIEVSKHAPYKECGSRNSNTKCDYRRHD